MKRQITIHARVSEPECRALDLLATREGLNRSEYVRLLARQEAKRQGISIPQFGFFEKPPMLAVVQNVSEPG
jgi:hypothetical protein